MIGQHYRPLLNLSSLLATSGGAKPLVGDTAACYAEVRKQTRQQLSNRSHFPGSFAEVNTARGTPESRKSDPTASRLIGNTFLSRTDTALIPADLSTVPLNIGGPLWGPVSLLYHPDMAQAREKRVHVFIHEKYITGDVGWIKIPT